MRIAFYAVSCLLICTRLAGQNPVAAFTSNKTSGCAPLSVSFSDQSTGNVKFWNWDFGNGTLSNQQNPTISYSAPGVYSVKLVVRNADGADGITKTGYITVNPSPIGSFTADKQLSCAPASIQFTDLSVPNAGTIVKWQWTFSDGTTSTQQNPSKQFPNAGYYDVSLIVTSSTGCIGSAGGNRYIRVVQGVKADFLDTLPAVCRAPFAVRFSNQTSGPGNLTYSWDFGNSSGSALTNPSAVYAGPGTYTVKLNAQSDYGCQGSVQKQVVLSNATASFSSPDSVCLNSAVNFQNTSTPASASVLWKFGDNTQSTQTNPAKTYTAVGTYAVWFISNFPGCTDSVTKNITVRSKPVAGFTAPKTTSCKGFTVNFQDTSPDATGWQWDFGDGGSSTQKNPAHPYSNPGQYNVTLTITDSKGCQNTITKSAFVVIADPVAAVGNVPDGGCAPYTFKPNSTSFSPEGIASYSWDFGDGGGIVTGSNPSYTYVGTGTYTIKLTVTSNDGCSNTITIPDAVKVGNHSVVNFDKDVSPVCHSSVVNFTNKSTPVGSPDPNPVFWTFGDGDTSSLANPAHKYADTGSYNVTLITNNNGCHDTLTQPNFIRVLPPVARFNYTVDCPSKRLVNFRDSSVVDPLHPNVYTWYFGDPTNATVSGAALTTPPFTYPATWPANYKVKLVIDDGTCIDSVTRTVRMVNETADFAVSKDTACRNETVSFTSLNAPSGNIKKYSWAVDGGAFGDAPGTFTTNFVTLGTHTVRLMVTDINDCVSPVVSHDIVVTGPTPGYSIANNGGCKGMPVQFTDMSAPSSATSTIDTWTWYFGDGGTGTGLTPTHTYADTGIYTVTLIVHDTRGCTEGLSVLDTITHPLAAFGTDTTLFCPGGPMTFRDSSLGRRINNWTWYFGDGSTGTGKNSVHAYAGGDAIYSIKLVIKDAFGCTDSVTRSNYVTIKKAKPAFGVKDSTTICPPLETQFFFQGKDYESFYWDFGDGGTSALQNPTHFFNTYGTDTVKLYLVGYGGCLDSATSVVNLYNPYSYSQLLYNPPQPVCNNLNVDFTVITPPSTKSNFYFGDGGVDSSQQSQLHHFYSTPSYNSPLVQLTDSTGCIVLVGGPTTIVILGAEPIFAMDQKRFCDSGIVSFTNLTVKNDPLVNEIWNFGDGNTITIPDTSNAIHTFHQPGLYVTSLTANTQAGCTKTLTDTVRVLRTPDPSITSADAACINNLVSFQGNLTVPDTAISWKWDFGNGQTSTRPQTLISYSTPGPYAIHATAANSLGCKDTTSTSIIINPLPSVTVTGDTTLLVGLGITIPVAYSSNVVSYNWTPATHLSCTDCATPYADPKFNTTYRVTATDSNGCSSTREITLITLCNNKNFFIPNTFSPNKDGMNDVFYPRGKGIDRIEALRIFNRWGELVFEKRYFPANDPTAGWDGTYKGKPSNTDTYIYMIDIICENALIVTYKGNVTLIR